MIPLLWACPWKPRRQRHLLCLPTTPGTESRPMCPLQPEQNIWRFWGRLPMPERFAMLVLALLFFISGCNRYHATGNIVTVLIESSPTNLDPRIGVDAQSERIDSLLFDALVRRDHHFNLQPWLAEKWETPNPLTYVFHLRKDVRFHNGHPLTSTDVKYTLDSILQGMVISVKANAYQAIDRVETPDPLTVVIYLKKPDPALLWNLSDGGFGVVPAGSGRDFWKHPIGSGPFAFVSQEQDKDVVLRR